MRKALRNIGLQKLRMLENTIENFDDLWLAFENDLNAPWPMCYLQFNAIAGFIREIGEEVDDYELIGIAETIDKKAQLLYPMENPEGEHE